MLVAYSLLPFLSVCLSLVTLSYTALLFSLVSVLLKSNYSLYGVSVVFLSSVLSCIPAQSERLPGQWILGKDASLVRSSDWVPIPGSAMDWVQKVESAGTADGGWQQVKGPDSSLVHGPWFHPVTGSL